MIKKAPFKKLLKKIGNYGAWSGIYSRFKDQKKHRTFIDFLKENYLPPKKQLK